MRDLSDTYYVVIHTHYTISLAAAFVTFAAIYLLIETIFDIRFRRWLSWGQFALMLLGTSMIFAPTLFLRLGAMPSRYNDQEPAFAFWSNVSTAGYSVTWASVVLFLALIVDIVVRRPQRKPRSDID